MIHSANRLPSERTPGPHALMAMFFSVKRHFICSTCAQGANATRVFENQ